MKIILEATVGPGAGRKIMIRPQQVVRIGRTQLADYCFDDGYLSSVHFSVSFDGRECRLQDLASSNGTFVNGQQVMFASLNSGDEISAGSCRFSVQVDMTSSYAGLPLPPAQPKAIAAPKSAGTADPAASGQAGKSTPAMARPFKTWTQSGSKTKVDLPDCFARGLGDDDAAVRQSALFAAVWTRQPWLLRHLAQRAADCSPEDLDGLRMFAVLAEPSHLSTILSLIRNPGLGPERFQLAGLFGHPGVVKDLLVAMSWKDAAVVTGAAAAFERITGAEIISEVVEEAPSGESEPSPRAAGAETSASHAVPGTDCAAARLLWRNQEPSFASGTRWSRGHDVSHLINDQVLRQLDLESRWGVLLRNHFYRRKEIHLPQLQLFGLVV